MIPLVRLQRQLFQRLKILTLKLANLPPKHRLRRGRAIDTTGLNGNHRMTPLLQKVMRVQRHDTGLVRLGDVGEDAVDHSDEHAVFEGVAGVLDDGDDVGAAFGHGEEVAAGTVGEFDGVDVALGTDDVGDVGDGGSGGGAEVEDLGAGFDPDVVHSAEDGGGELGSEWIPNTIFHLDRIPIRSRRTLHAYPLLAVHGHARRAIQRDERILLPARDEHALVSMGFDDHLRSALHSAAASSSAASAAVSSSPAAASSSSATEASASSASSSSATEASSAARRSSSSSTSTTG
mmetsp:Transcript_13796/g.17847  ORF Transcript_13796/g.17847 Transcript_13796/m.17847 type:complete len:291 (-) Transcript_13796:33-905(-)